MSLMNACQRFFEIPELCGLIACYLCPHDLTRLSLVCKAFHRRFNSFVWEKLTILHSDDYRVYRFPRTQGLKHNGHLIKHAELSSCYEGAWARWGLYDDDYQDTDFEATGENNDTLLATTLLKHCGSNLTSLVISDGSFDGRLLSIFLSRIKGDTNWNGAERLDNIQKLEIGVTKLAFETLLQPLISELSQKRSSGTSVIFSDVTDLRLDAQRQPDLDEYGSDWDDELCYSTDGNVDGNPQAPEIDIRDLIRTFPSLRNLALVDTRISISNSVQPQSENEQDEDESTEAKAAAVYHLHSLNLQDCTVSTEQMTWILERTRDLKSLKLGSSLVGNPEVFISSLPTLAPNLREYSQECLPFLAWPDLFQGLPHLVKLRISSGQKMEDDHLRILAECCPALEDLELHYCNSLTYTGLMSVLWTSARLRSLRLPRTLMDFKLFELDTAPSSSSTSSYSSAENRTFIPWACQNTLRVLELHLTGDCSSKEIQDSVRERLQHISNLRHLELSAESIPVSMLLATSVSAQSDAKHSSRSSIMIYPSLEKISVEKISPSMTLALTRKLIDAMPRLEEVKNMDSFDDRARPWLYQYLKDQRR